MALCRIPTSTFTTHKLSSPPSLSFATKEGHFRWEPHVKKIPCKGLTITCSAQKSSGGKKKRSSRVNMSDADLCRELLNFVAAERLPYGHVPSTSELAKRGRKDLANIVRRRGRKSITELLRMQINEITQPEESPTVEFANVRSYRLSGDENSGITADVINCIGPSIELPSKDNLLYGYNGASAVTDDTSRPLVPAPCENAVQLAYNKESTLKVAKDQYLIRATKEETDSAFAESRNFSNERNYCSQPLEGSDAGTEIGVSETGFTSSVKTPSRGTMALAESPSGGEDISVEEADGTDQQIEIDNLKVMLQEKEMELLQLRREIEKEKLALATLQNEAAAEMDYIQNLISQKDAELSAAEESLSGLKEVLIEYQGHGETVEIAGSFNGWHHRVKMDRYSSLNLNSTETRDGPCWTAALWLYPGVYEIKFVVDGHWKTDPHRESVTRGHITNNIIRVER